MHRLKVAGILAGMAPAWPVKGTITRLSQDIELGM